MTPRLCMVLAHASATSRHNMCWMRHHQRAGAILVFLPGWDDIVRIRDTLRVREAASRWWTALCSHRRVPIVDVAQGHPKFSDESKAWILPLHSAVPSREQRRVFVTPPPGVRKIVLATNIAETRCGRWRVVGAGGWI